MYLYFVQLCFVQTYQKKLTRENVQKRKESPYTEISPVKDHIRKGYATMTRKAYMRNKLQLQNHSSVFMYKNESLLSATNLLSRYPMAYNTASSMDKLTCTDILDFGNCEKRCGRFSWYRNDSNYLDVKLDVFKRNENRDLRLVQDLNGRGRLQPLHAFEESAGHCSRKVW